MTVQTKQDGLNSFNFNYVQTLLAKGKFGDFLASFCTPTTGTAAVASDAITLPSLPIPGSVQLTGNAATTAELLIEQLPGAGAIVESGFKVDYDTGVITFNASQFADAEVITYRYQPVTRLVDPEYLAGQQLADPDLTA